MFPLSSGFWSCILYVRCQPTIDNLLFPAHNSFSTLDFTNITRICLCIYLFHHFGLNIVRPSKLSSSSQKIFFYCSFNYCLCSLSFLFSCCSFHYSYDRPSGSILAVSYFFSCDYHIFITLLCSLRFFLHPGFSNHKFRFQKWSSFSSNHLLNYWVLKICLGLGVALENLPPSPPSTLLMQVLSVSSGYSTLPVMYSGFPAWSFSI